MVFHAFFSVNALIFVVVLFFEQNPSKKWNANNATVIETQNIFPPSPAFLISSSFSDGGKKNSESPPPSPDPIDLASFLFSTFLTCTASNPLIFES